MNEKGLCVADLMVEPGKVIHQTTEKPDLTVVAALRLLLDKAATVGEALALLQQYDMNFSLEAAHHFAISDAGGNCVAVKYIGDNIVVIKTNTITNHYIAQVPGLPEGFEASRLRFEILDSSQKQAGMTEQEVRRAIAAAAASHFHYLRENHENRRTQWTLICRQDAATALFYRNEDWSHPYSLSLANKAWISAAPS